MLVMIDNFDSFTYNLYQYLMQMGAEVRVARNNSLTLEALEALGPRGLVISPGPGRPEDAGITVAAIRRFSGRIPILGVCLGHQAIALAFGGEEPAHRYALEEVREIVVGSGFAPVEPTEEAIPYLCSPASRHGRIETVVSFAATKTAEAVRLPPARRSPDWLESTDLPVPLLPELAGRQLELRVLAHVASLVDGRRSVRDIARVLVEQRLMAEAEAEPAVRAFLARLHEEARARAAGSP